MSSSAPASIPARPSSVSSPRVRAAIPAGLIALALLGAVLAVVFLAPGVGAEPAEVYIETDGARYIVTMKSAEIGERSEKDGAESIRWVRLDVPSDSLDSETDTMRVAHGSTKLDRITEVRLTFMDVRIVIDGTMHHLHLDQDTLHVRLDTPGAKGDSLLVVLDGPASVAAGANGVLSFTPKLLETAWGPGQAKESRAPERAHPPSSTASPNPPPSAPGGSLVPPPQNAPQNNNQQPPPPPVGHIELFFSGQSHGLASDLNITITKVALGHAGDRNATLTWFQGAKKANLVAAAEEPIHMMTAQVPVGSYGTIHIETGNATARFSAAGERAAFIPQPRLVLEVPFNITTGHTLGILIEIGVEESLRIGLSGLEYRPVVTDIVVGETERETGVTTLLTPYPAQYRTDGAWLPSLGERGDQLLREQGQDPASIPHPIYGDIERPAGSEGSLADPELPSSVRDEITGLTGGLGG